MWETLDPFGYPYDDFCRIRVNGLENCSQMDLLLFFFLSLIRRCWMEPRFSHTCGRAELTCHMKTRRRRGTFVDEINFATNFIQIQSHRKEGAKTDPEAGCVLSPVWTAARQAPLSMGFSRQEYWGGLLCPPPGNLLDPGIKSTSPALRVDSLFLSPMGSQYAECLLVIQNAMLKSFLETLILNLPGQWSCLRVS